MDRSCFCMHLESVHHSGRCVHCHCTEFEDTTTEHTQFLRDLAETGLAIAKKDLERSGRVAPIFVLRDGKGESRQLSIPEDLANIMNSGRAKDAIFGFVRDLARHMEATAVVIVADGYFGKPTLKARSMSPKEYTKGATTMDAAIQAGLCERVEALLITVQTPVRVLNLNQLYERDSKRHKIRYLEMVVMEAEPDQFMGRQKMFGDLRAENLQ